MREGMGSWTMAAYVVVAMVERVIGQQHGGAVPMVQRRWPHGLSPVGHSCIHHTINGVCGLTRITWAA